MSRVWEGQADPKMYRVSKSGPEPSYPAYGDSDKTREDIRVAAVTQPRSTSDQIEELFRRLLTGVITLAQVPAPVPEVPVVEQLLQHLVTEMQIRQPALVDWSSCLEKCSRDRRRRHNRLGRDPSGVIGMLSYVSRVGSRVIVRLAAPPQMRRFLFYCWVGRPRRRHVVML